MKKKDSRKLGATTSLGSQEALGTLGRDMKRRGSGNAVGAGRVRRRRRWQGPGPRRRQACRGPRPGQARSAKNATRAWTRVANAHGKEKRLLGLGGLQDFG